MDFDLDADQQDLLSSVTTLLERHAGADRAREVLEDEGYDAELMNALVEAGFADMAEAGAGPLEAVLVTERVAAAAGRVPFATRAILAPALLEQPIPQVVAVLDEPGAPVRFAERADVLLAERGDAVVRIDPAEVEISPVPSAFGLPFATVTTAHDAGTTISGVDAATFRRWRQVALAAEMVGSMHRALTLTVEYVSERRAFGRPLGALQAIQHSLAELFVRVDGARWLTRHAAYHGASAEEAAVACAMAAVAAERTVAETHQLTGAMGLTREYDLYLWTMPLTALRQEAGGLRAHSAAVSHARWGLAGAVEGELTDGAVARHPIEDGGGASVASAIT